MLNLKPEKKKMGILFAILAPLFYALKSSSVKFALPIKIEQLWFLRLVFDVLVLSPFLFKAQKNFLTKRLPLHFFRAALVTGLSFASVYGIRKLALVDIVLLESSFPLFIPLVLWIWHRQKATFNSWIILWLGFFAIIFISNLRFTYGIISSCAGLGIALLSAISVVSVNTLSKTESSTTILFYYYLFSILITSAICIWTWEGFPNIPNIFWLPFILHSIFGVLFQFSVVQAYSLIPAHFAGGFSYLAILFSTLFGWLIWNESLNVLQIIGGVLLVILGLLMTSEKGKRYFSEQF